MQKKQNKNIIHKSKPVQTKQVVSQSIGVYRSGPLPTPAELEKYDLILPGAADRIITMAEKQQNHRMDLEKSVINQQMKESSRGQIFGFILGLVGLASSAYIISLGYEIGGSIMGGGSLTMLVSLFVVGKREQKKNLESKNQTIQ